MRSDSSNETGFSSSSNLVSSHRKTWQQQSYTLKTGSNDQQNVKMFLTVDHRLTFVNNGIWLPVISWIYKGSELEKRLCMNGYSYSSQSPPTANIPPYGRTAGRNEEICGLVIYFSILETVNLIKDKIFVKAEHFSLSEESILIRIWLMQHNT